MSFCLNSIKMEARTLAEAQGYDSVLDMTLQESRMDQQTLDAMWTAHPGISPPFPPLSACQGSLFGAHGRLALL